MLNQETGLNEFRITSDERLATRVKKNYMLAVDGADKHKLINL